jgi:hypothetical protein
MKRHSACLYAAALLAAFLIVAANSATVSAWSNGGYSSNPAHPDYGTHDWIAEHVLDWLPAQEKQFLTDNVAVYLYGTELPDNSQAPDGVGDTAKHHVYFFANGTLQDGAAAVRAGEEYVNAKLAYLEGNSSDAAKHLGMMAHYVADMAVFGHVMGASTAWGAEVHHSEYEDYVLDKTRSYTSEFASFLVFDGNLDAVTAYDAAIAIARDTTFDENGGLTCTWMDQHYNWSDATFRNRAGESLNLAVNAVVDVLHSFYGEAVISEFPSGLAFMALVLAVLPVIACAKKRFSIKT